MDSLTLTSPAKINLMLSVHGPRGDGFHALTSLVVTLNFGDVLQVTLNTGQADYLECTSPEVPLGEENLIIQAANAFRARLGEPHFFNFQLEKRIPMGAGLGGGSSNAAVALGAMNQLTGGRLDRESLLALAASLGSDCPLFIEGVPTVMSGRGEVLEALPDSVAKRLRGRRVLLFRPDFGVHTGWAYGQLMAASPSTYELERKAHARLDTLTAGGAIDTLLYNTFEASVGAKYLAITCLLEQLRAMGVACLMSGSGSCCFALVENDAKAMEIRRICSQAWGDGVFFIETSIR